MSYNNKVWKTGDTITESALNNIETGIKNLDAILTNVINTMNLNNLTMIKNIDTPEWSDS